MTEKHTEQVDEQVAADLQSRLRATEHDLDTRTSARLAAARREALAQNNAGSRSQRWSFGLPAMGTVAALAAVAVVVAQIGLPGGNTPELQDNQEQLEFYEDLEFYEWLAENELEEVSA